MKPKMPAENIEPVWLLCWYPNSKKDRPAWCKKHNPDLKPCVFCLDSIPGKQCRNIGITSYPEERIAHMNNARIEKYGGKPITFSAEEREIERDIWRLKKEEKK